MLRVALAVRRTRLRIPVLNLRSTRGSMQFATHMLQKQSAPVADYCYLC
jgi:hypothetical protein